MVFNIQFRALSLAVVLLCFCIVKTGHAGKQTSVPIAPDFSMPDEKKKEPDVLQLEDLPADAPVEDFIAGKPQSKRRHIYEKPT